MENLWKSCNNILWTIDDSAIGRINIWGDPDSAIGRKKPNKKSPGAKRLDKLKEPSKWVGSRIKIASTFSYATGSLFKGYMRVAHYQLYCPH